MVKKQFKHTIYKYGGKLPEETTKRAEVRTEAQAC